MRHSYVLKYSSLRKNRVFLLMITDYKKMYYAAVKRFSALPRGITCNHNDDFYCLSCLNCLRKENKLKKYENVRQNHDCCYIESLKKIKMH